MHSQTNTHARHFRYLLLVALAALAVALVVPLMARAQSEAESRMVNGHVALDRSQYRSAANHFRQAASLAEDAGNEQEQAEALYWQAFSLHRLGGNRDLQEAAERLLDLRELSMNQDLLSEARALALRIKAELAEQGDARAARELTEMLDQMTADHQQMEQKLIALQALMHMNPERAKPILEEVLRSREPGTEELRRQAVFLMTQGGAEGSEELLMDLAANDPDPEVRQQAVFWLGQSGSSESLQFFSQLIAEEDDPEIIEQAVFALSQSGDEAAGEVLRDLAVDERHSTDVRQMAVFGLGHQGTRTDRDFLRDLYSDLDEPELKEHVLHAVAQEDDPGTAEWLIDIALDADEDPESRKMALFWAGQQGHLPLARLDSLYADIDDTELREQIIFVLAQDGSDQAMQRLMTLAREEHDPELRRQAIFWIGQSGAEGAEEFLLEIINE